MLINRTAVFALGIFVCATAAKTQDPPVSHVKRVSVTAEVLNITLDGTVCKQVQSVLVVMNGDEGHLYVADPPKADGTCRWTAKHGSFDTEETWFSLRLSLRLGSARTVCAYAKGDKQKKSGQLVFTCCRTGGHDVEVSTKSVGEEIPFSYTREVLENADPKEPSGCAEIYSTVGLLVVPIPSVWFPVEALPEEQNQARTSAKALPAVEKVRLQLGLANANTKWPGLIINDRFVTKHLNNGSGTLSVSDMREVFRKQCSGGDCSIRPGLSADGFLTELQDRGLRNIKVTLTK